jgi:hypothetical protein
MSVPELRLHCRGQLAKEKRAEDADIAARNDKPYCKPNPLKKGVTDHVIVDYYDSNAPPEYSSVCCFLSNIRRCRGR